MLLWHTLYTRNGFSLFLTDDYVLQMLSFCRLDFLSVSTTSSQGTSSQPPGVDITFCPFSVFLLSIFPPRLCFCFIREGLRRTVCSDSCSNSYTRFQRADVFTEASHAYFPRGDAFRRRPELELKWPFTRNTSWETGGAEWQNTPWPDADGVVCVCVSILLW